MSKRILGIDPGTNVLGYGVLQVNGNHAEVVVMGVIEFKDLHDPYSKLQRIYEKTSKELRDEGFLTSATVQVLNIEYTKNICKGLDYQAEKEWLGICKERNEFLTKLLFTLRKNSLVMVNYLNHGFTLEEYLKKFNDSLP